MLNPQIQELSDATVKCWADCNKIKNKLIKGLGKFEFRNKHDREKFERKINGSVMCVADKWENLFDQYRKVLKDSN